MKFVLALLFLLIFAVDARGQTTIYVSSGVDCNNKSQAVGHCASTVSSGITAGNDTTGDGSIGNPYLTIRKAVQVAGYSAANVTIEVRQGVYDTGGFVTDDGTDTLLGSGTSFAAPFTFHAYDGAGTATFVRGLAPGATHTITEVQAGVHVPTLANCQYYNTLYPGKYLPYPSNCWAGTEYPGEFMWLRQDDTGDVLAGAVIDLVYISNPTSVHVPVQYVVFDGIDLDARGITNSVIGSTFRDDTHHPLLRHVKFQNLTIRNAVGSCMVQPGDNRQTDYQGNANLSDWQILDSVVHHCGVPFDTYVIPAGQPYTGQVARETIWARYLHPIYAHVGGFTIDNTEVYSNAGQGFLIPYQEVTLSNSYIHDNGFIGIIAGGYGSGGNSSVYNNLFVNNGGMCAQLWYDVVFENNTCVAGTREAYTAIELQDKSGNGTIVQNNILSGFGSGVHNYLCRTRFSDGACDPNGANIPAANIVRNNLIKNATPGSELVNDVTDVPMATSNNLLNQDPGFTNAAGGDYSITTSSAASNAGYSNALATDYLGAARPDPPSIGAYEPGGVQPVNTTVTSGAPPSTTTSTTINVAFTGSGGTGPYTYERNLDSAGYVSATSPLQISGLALGAHTLLIRAIDSTPTTDSTPASLSWTIVAVSPPDTIIDSNPTSSTTSTTATFTFHATGVTGSTSFTCTLDGASAACTSPATYTVAVGTHTFSVAATDSGTALTDPSPATYTWTVTSVQGGGTFVPGRCVEVIASPFLNIRDPASSDPENADVVGTQATGATGTITCCDATTTPVGPIVRSFGGYWIKVDYTTGQDGWHSDNAANLVEIACGVSTPPPVFTQGAFQGYSLRTDGQQRVLVKLPRTTSSANTNFKVMAGGSFILGTQIDVTAEASGAKTLALYYKLNSGSFTAVPNTYGVDHVKFFGTSDTSADIPSANTAVSSCVAGALTTTSGVTRRDNTTASLDVAVDTCTAFNWIISFESTAVVGDTYQFRVYQSDGTALDTYNQTPTVTIVGEMAGGGS